jgi:hypothetical protein
MATSQCDNTAHKTAVNLAEGVRQVAVAAAGSNQVTINASEITFFRACLASAKTNGVPTSHYVEALRALGTWQ